jgi:hypothetical protein
MGDRIVDSPPPQNSCWVACAGIRIRMLPIVGKDCDIAVSAGMPALLALRNRVAAIARHQHHEFQ